MTGLQVEHLSLDFGGVVALEEFSLSVGQGEFVTLLGPSGSGKTSALRIIGGYVRPRTGRVVIDGRDVTRLPPQQRNVGMVFQQYALFPHMRVADNVAFGLRARRCPADEVSTRVNQTLELVQLKGFERRYPHELSGGQQQRVALARAIAVRPALLLMDEPLAALDLRLRETLQVDIRRIQRALGIATLYVTHDQGEAFTLSDRVVVMDRGRMVSTDTPSRLLDRPDSVFTARFVGNSNVLSVDVESWKGSSGVVRIRGSAITVGIEGQAPLSGRDLYLSVRPDLIWVSQVPTPESLRGRVVGKRFVGFSILLTVDVGGPTLAVLDPSHKFSEGNVVYLGWERDATILLEAKPT